MKIVLLELSVVLAVHDRQLAEHGGAAGVRDMKLLESALARPRQLVAYGAPDIYDLAAVYAGSIVRNHPFVDGNKRTAYVACMLFLRLHGVGIEAPDPERVFLFERLGRGALVEKDLAAWLRKRGTKAV